MWKDYLKRDNEHIAKRNARAKEVREGEIRSKVIAAKQGVPKEVWFKPVTGKFSGEEFTKEYVQK